MQLKTAYLEKKGRIATITLNRPEVLNAADNQWVADLNALGDAVAQDDEVRVVIVTGAGRAFCTGIDLKALSAGEIKMEFFHGWERAMRLFETMEKVTIAGINGYCLGGGLQLAIACDIRVARDDARLGLPAVKECLIPGLAPYRLPRFIGMGRAKRLILSGDLITAREARDMGLVDYLFKPKGYEAKLNEVAERFLKTAPTSSRLCKMLTNRAFDTPFEPFLKDYFKAQQMAIESPEHKEAMAAYREKREPRF